MRWVIEAKGETADTGLDFGTGLGQFLQGMEDPQSRYALAMPDTPKFERRRARVPDWMRTSRSLQWILVDADGELAAIPPPRNRRRARRPPPQPTTWLAVKRATSLDLSTRARVRKVTGMDESQKEDREANGQTRPGEGPSTPQEDVPTEEDVKQDLPGVPDEVDED